MKSTYKIYVKIGFLFCALSVILGAFGSHALKDVISEHDISVFETGVKYQFMHALGIVLIGLNYRKLNQKLLPVVLILFILGIIIFSGSLYLLSTRSIWSAEDNKMFGAITPIGGLAFIFGWLLLTIKGFSSSEDVNGYDKIGEDEEKSHRHHRHHRKSKSSSETVS